VILSGVESFPQEDFNPIIQKYENHEVSLHALRNLARDIKIEYLKKMVIASCIVPPQDIKDGVVTLEVTEAKMGTFTVGDAPFYENNWIYNYWTIEKGEVIRYDELRKSLYLMNKNPDRDVNANLKAGSKPGTTDIILEQKTHFPIHPFFTYDNEGVRSTGLDRFGFGIRDNNALFVDDTLLAGYTFGKDFSGYYAYHLVPVTNFGTGIMYGYSNSQSHPRKEFTQFGINSKLENYSFFIQQDIFKEGNYLGELSLGMDIKDKVTHFSGGTLNRDRLRILRLQSLFTFPLMKGHTYLSGRYSQGLNILVARRRNALSSRGADCIFSKFNLDVKYIRRLPFDLQTVLTFKSQLSSTKLTPQEEYFLGGIDSVRGYPSGDFLADNVIQANCDILIPAFFIPESVKLPYDDTPLSKNINGLVFFDYGYGIKRGSIPSEKHEANFASIGPGVRVRLYDKAVLRCAWGFVLGDKPLTETADSRFHMSINTEF